MEALGDMMRGRVAKNKAAYATLKEKILADPEISTFILNHQLKGPIIDKSLANLRSYLLERQKFEDGITLYYKPQLVINQGFADYELLPTQALAQAQSQMETKRRVHLVGLPKRMKNIRLPQVLEVANPERREVISAVLDFIERFDGHGQGLYIYGSFGVGKSFIMAAMANELAATKAVKTQMVHYPSFVSELTYENRLENLTQLKTAQLLILDDVGAESSNAWLRDDVLQVILQYRMDNQLSTFFTSNLDPNEYEAHLATTKQGMETWPAKRLMERVRYLSRPIQLKGGNLRHE